MCNSFLNNQNQPITQATRNAEFVHVANTILKVRFAQIVFVFAIKFSTFNKGFRSRQFCGYLFRTSCSLKPLAVITPCQTI